MDIGVARDVFEMKYLIVRKNEQKINWKLRCRWNIFLIHLPDKDFQVILQVFVFKSNTHKCVPKDNLNFNNYLFGYRNKISCFSWSTR